MTDRARIHEVCVAMHATWKPPHGAQCIHDGGARGCWEYASMLAAAISSHELGLAAGRIAGAEQERAAVLGYLTREAWRLLRNSEMRHHTEAQEWRDRSTAVAYAHDDIERGDHRPLAEAECCR